jgi:ABC-type branched-subunit amino acid transport system substrate-binding protein
MAGSANTDEIAKALHKVSKEYDGATGDKSFDQDGMQVIEYYRRMVYQCGRRVPYK